MVGGLAYMSTLLHTCGVSLTTALEKDGMPGASIETYFSMVIQTTM